MHRFRVIALVLWLTVSVSAEAATVFYLHGKIVEDQGDNAVHATYGVYEYGNIVSRLEDAGHDVLSEVRSANTDRAAYADHVVEEIQAAIASGTAPSDIVVVGFSKGAQIALLVFTASGPCGRSFRHPGGLRKLVGEIR